MKRRLFFKKSTTALVGLGITTSSCTNTTNREDKIPFKVSTTVDQNKVFFYSEVITESIKVIHIADTHLFKDDERGIPYQQYSNRMAKAYNETTHFQTGEKTNPEEAFEQALAFAKDVNADVITLIGDIFSFPSSGPSRDSTLSPGTNARIPKFCRNADCFSMFVLPARKLSTFQKLGNESHKLTPLP